MYLLYVRDRTGVMRFERAHDAEGRGDDMNEAVRCAEEKIG